MKLIMLLTILTKSSRLLPDENGTCLWIQNGARLFVYMKFVVGNGRKLLHWDNENKI